MKEIMMKARSGVTLVELLVVVLIVTILSVSMLPLLQPFVTEAQYAAEAIPVISNMRTKIGLHVYEKGRLPYDMGILDTQGKVETWRTDDKDDVYYPTTYTLVTAARTTPVSLDAKLDKAKWGGHVQGLLDIDYQDLKGKRSKPLHYQYYAISTNTSSYVIGCFGDGNGLKKGTGYAVCELNFPQAGRKLIGTWKRYKSYTDTLGAIAFSTFDTTDDVSGKVLDCYVPEYASIKDIVTSDAVDEQVVAPMVAAGWEF